MQQEHGWVPPGIDLTRPSAARVYDYYLGGSHNFGVDRELARVAIEDWPELPMIMQANRAFLRRAVKFCVQAGIRQFLDIGSGIPTVGNVHEVAQELDPDCRVVYVDIDPVAVAHSRIMLAGNDFSEIVQADLRQPERVLDAPQTKALLDLSQPVAVLMVAVLHFVPDEADPAGLVRRYLDAVAPGSFLVLSHACLEGVGEQAEFHQKLYRRAGSALTIRPVDQVAGLFGPARLVEPGLVRLPLWRPDPAAPYEGDPAVFAGFAAVGQKV
ncbi:MULTISPECIES: SAM-dependent methyltransferase [unclassified Crossiella]|uniref:SAM-dependent methyltransferase n=1 Tax=unclassified Crossiella TaxID=2620835 RepID=UPI001FFF29C8|nr:MULTISPECIES: SAM-dependent methyltransferase [unclassified Crossiella]MCK2236501.1 SAM-dependent methyltransferase [Crossiella sp. S99.2]MCK2250168.1 SAM-dependent methyltransferase [Crossiella sp. S99.1]